MTEQLPSTTARDPTRTRQTILEAAVVEFSEKGLQGARIADIARRAQTNYQALYYHFGNKEDLYAAALESTIRLPDGFRVPDVEEVGPAAALCEVIDGVFDAFFQKMGNISLWLDENMHMARHLDAMPGAQRVMHELYDTIRRILSVGEHEHVFKKDLDPFHVYSSIIGLPSNYISSIPMNSSVFGRDFGSVEEIERWRAHTKEMLLAGYCAEPQHTLDDDDT